jgi:flagellar biosynthesis/type III secretory pathway protein FliH
LIASSLCCEGWKGKKETRKKKIQKGRRKGWKDGRNKMKEEIRKEGNRVTLFFYISFASSCNFPLQV